MFLSEDLEISLSTKSLDYFLYFSKEKREFKQLPELLTALNDLPKQSFFLLGHNFKGEVSYLLNTLLKFEKFYINKAMEVENAWK